MPRLVVLRDDGFTALCEEAYLDEDVLQRLLEEHPELIALDDVEPTASPLVPIGREVPLAGQSLDLLFIDLSGGLTAVETKLRRNPQVRREVVGQILEYGAYLSSWSVEDVERQAARYLSDPRTPARFQSQSVYEALSRSGEDEPAGEGSDEDELRGRISTSLAEGDIRLIIAVDRIVDPLRALVGYLNGASRFRLFLLEIQQYKAPDETKIASIGVYGGTAARHDGATRTRTVWDERGFFETLRANASPAAAAVVQDLYSFMQNHADSLVWGTGATVGSIGLGLRRGGDRFTIFGVNTMGEVQFSTGALNKRAPREPRASLLDTLRSLGVDAPDEFLEVDRWLTFHTDHLQKAADLERFKSAILQLRDSIVQPG